MKYNSNIDIWARRAYKLLNEEIPPWGIDCGHGRYPTDANDDRKFEEGVENFAYKVGDEVNVIHAPRENDWNMGFVGKNAQVSKQETRKDGNVYLVKSPDGKEAYFYEEELTPAKAVDEVAPPGFEKVVKGLKKNPDVDNPWAVAWSMKNKGYKHECTMDESAPPNFPKKLYNKIKGEYPGNPAAAYATMWKAHNQMKERVQMEAHRIKETSSTGGSGVGMNIATPFAFSGGTDAGRKKTEKNATNSTGYKIVGKIEKSDKLEGENA